MSVRDQDALLEFATDVEELYYGLLLWESAIVLARFFAANEALLAARSVLELGAGVGLPGLVARTCGAEVCQTDYTSVAFPLAEYNATENCISDMTRFLGDWRDWKHNEQYDLVVGSDILYDRTLHYLLLDLFQRNLKRGGTLVLTDPGRPPAREFVALLQSRGWTMRTVQDAVPPLEAEESAKPVLVTVLVCSRIP